MPAPKKRHNSSRGKRRRGGHPKISAVSLVVCKKCGKKIMPHRVCQYCGSYKEKSLVK